MKKIIKLITVVGAASLLLTSCQLFVRIPTYTVTWQNYDGSILEVDEKVKQGEMPSYEGANPERAQTDEFYYVWNGWTSEVSEVTSDITYVATFKEETRIYQITWNNYDGETLKTEEVAYGVVPEYKGEEPTKEQTIEHTYSFDGWSPEVEAVTGDKTYTATFEENLRKYQITWKDDDGTILKTEEVEYGKVPEYGNETPFKENTVDQTFAFNGWSPNVLPVSGDTEYRATYRSDVRKYEVSWKNYDGALLKVDLVPYGSIPSYEGTTPVRTARAIEYTFTGWSPEITNVTGDAEYTAQFSEKAFFSFDPVNYVMQPGYKISDINGAPWINSNIRGELNKIKQPSIKEDFYAAVNYDDILSNKTGAFGDSDVIVDQAFDSIYSGAASSATTNGAIIKTTYNKISSGSVSQISSYLNNLDLDTYLSSKDSFMSKNSLLNIIASGTGYEVEYKDGYLTGMNYGDYTYLGLLYTFTNTAPTAKNIINFLSNKFGLNLTSDDLDNTASKEYDLVNQAYNDYYYQGTGTTSYSVNTIPWAPMKEALLDLGLTSTTRIYVKNLYKNCLNTIYNDLSVNDPSLLRKMILARLAYDNRFFVGTSSYKQVNQFISNLADYFGDEAYLAWQRDSEVNKTLARLIFPELMEQTYLELCGDTEVKADVDSLINDVLAAYKTLADESWLTNTTKTKMKRKLNKMAHESCYSDVYLNIARIGGDDRTTKTPYELYKLYRSSLVNEAMHGNVDTSGFFNSMHSWTVNAFYSPTDNAFVILNGIVSGLLGKSIEERYGMLAMVIGHEITHAFDSSGSQFDENGNQSNWWSMADKSTFNNKVNKLIDFYDQIALKSDYYCDGDTVDGEATADLGGMKVALMLAKNVDNFDYDKFFRAYAYLWLTSTISINDVQSRASDSHPFNYLRVNVVVSQFDEFVDTYDIKPGDGMYVPEDERIKIW